MRIALPVAFDGCVQGDRVRTRVALVAIITVIGIGPEDHFYFRLAAANHIIRNADRCAIPQTAAEVGLQM